MSYQAFSESPIWGLQEKYFQLRGPAAWGGNEVPHYVTNNPYIARDYARLIMAYFRDLHRQGRGNLKVHLLELGAGSGRLAYLILKALEKMESQAPFPLPPYTYVLSDLPRANLEFWRGHPRFGKWLRTGKLDIAQLDAAHPQKARLEIGGRDLLPSLQQGPVILLANYFFDSIPQDLFHIKGYQVRTCHVETLIPESSGAEKEQGGGDPAEVLGQIRFRYAYQDLSHSYYENGEMDEILHSYAGKVQDTHLLFPQIGLRLLQQLLGRTPHGAMVLSADKGEYRVEELDGQTPPEMITHGSFSLQVNYHAIHQFCRLRGGKALAPKYLQFSLPHHCLLFPPGPHPETEYAYRIDTGEFGPDDYHGIKLSLQKYGPSLDFRELVAAVRFSQYDPWLFSQLLPQTKVIAQEIGAAIQASGSTKATTAHHDQALTLVQLIVKVWDHYYPFTRDDQKDGLALEMAALLELLGFRKMAHRFRDL